MIRHILFWSLLGLGPCALAMDADNGDLREQLVQACDNKDIESVVKLLACNVDAHLVATRKQLRDVYWPILKCLVPAISPDALADELHEACLNCDELGFKRLICAILKFDFSMFKKMDYPESGSFIDDGDTLSFTGDNGQIVRNKRDMDEDRLVATLQEAQSRIMGWLCLQKLKKHGDPCATLLCGYLKPKLSSYLHWHISCADYFSLRQLINRPQDDGYSMLMRAAAYQPDGRFNSGYLSQEYFEEFRASCFTMGRILLAAGAEIDTQNRWNETALYLALQAKNDSLAKILIERGADPAKTSSGHAPFFAAIDRNLADMCKLMLDRGLDPNCMIAGRSLLTFASSYKGREKIIKELLDTGASPNAQNPNGRTALMNACRGACIENCKLLLQYGADLLIKDALSRTAIDHTFEAQQQRGGDSHRKIITLVTDSKEIRSLIVQEDNPNARSWRETDQNIGKALFNREMGIE